MNKIGKIGFLGGGMMAQAMAKGFIAAGLTKPEAIMASVHPADKVSQESLKQIGVQMKTENQPVVEQSDTIFLSVKPQMVPEVLTEVRGLSEGKLFLSVAMGIKLANIEASLSSKARVIRVMPNLPVVVQAGCSVYVRGTNATDADVELTQILLRSIGTCEPVPEHLIDCVTALSGSGPAYIFVFIEALADSAVRMGMPRDMAYRLASQTVIGSGLMVRETGKHPAVLKDNVTSPGGSTAAALKHLEERGFRAAVAGAIEAATLRCRAI